MGLKEALFLALGKKVMCLVLYIIDLHEEGDFYADNIYTVCLYLNINKYTS